MQSFRYTLHVIALSIPCVSNRRVLQWRRMCLAIGNSKRQHTKGSVASNRSASLWFIGGVLCIMDDRSRRDLKQRVLVVVQHPLQGIGSVAGPADAVLRWEHRPRHQGVGAHEVVDQVRVAADLQTTRQQGRRAMSETKSTADEAGLWSLAGNSSVCSSERVGRPRTSQAMASIIVPMLLSSLNIRYGLSSDFSARWTSIHLWISPGEGNFNDPAKMPDIHRACSSQHGITLPMARCSPMKAMVGSSGWKVHLRNKQGGGGGGVSPCRFDGCGGFKSAETAEGLRVAETAEGLRVKRPAERFKSCRAAEGLSLVGFGGLATGTHLYRSRLFPAFPIFSITSAGSRSLMSLEAGMYPVACEKPTDRLSDAPMRRARGSAVALLPGRITWQMMSASTEDPSVKCTVFSSRWSMPGLAMIFPSDKRLRYPFDRVPPALRKSSQGSANFPPPSFPDHDRRRRRDEN